MSLLGGLSRSLVNPISLASLATGPAGWASLAVRTLGAAIGQQGLQQLGEKLGLPLGMIDIAKSSFGAAVDGVPGSIADAVSTVGYGILCPSEQGAMTREMSQQAENIAENLFAASREGSDRAKTEGSREGRAGSGNWLRAIAEVMAQSMDAKIDEMQSRARDLRLAVEEQQVDQVDDRPAGRDPGIQLPDAVDDQHDQDDRRRPLDDGS